MLQFGFRQLLDGENRDGVDHQADDRVDDSGPLPALSAAAHGSHKAHSHSLDNQAARIGEDETQGTHLNALAVILGDQSGQRTVGDVVGSVEHTVQHRIGNEEEGVLGALAPVHGDGETRSQADAVADVGPEHPRTSLAHLGLGLVDHGAEENVRYTVKDLGHRHQGADDTGVQADGIRQVDHDEEVQQCPDNIAGNVTGAVTDLVVPLQVSLLLHGGSPLCLLRRSVCRREYRKGTALL